MTKHLLILIATVLLVSSTFGEQKTNPVKQESICGTWVRTQKLADGSANSLMKIITPTHFAVFQQDSARKNGNVFQAHSGTYKLENDVMVEVYEFSSNPATVGRTGRSRLEVNAKTLRQTWTPKNGTPVVEEWNRLPPRGPEKHRDA
jgi:hypothetical protein